MSKIGIIGAAPLLSIDELEITHKQRLDTPYGETSGRLIHGLWQGKEIVMLYRSGAHHKIPPHRINYRANIWALQSVGVKWLLGVSPGTGIRADLSPGSLVTPHQIIDYTHSRDSSFFEDIASTRHIDFRYPFSEELRDAITLVADDADIELSDEAVLGVTQGPRLETLAEINRYERDGCDLIGMTAMPETILASEAQIQYANLTLIMNKAAGKDMLFGAGLTDMSNALKDGMTQLHQIIGQTLLAIKNV